MAAEANDVIHLLVGEEHHRRQIVTMTSLTDHEHEPFWRSSTAISGSVLTFVAAEVVSPS